MRERSYYRNRLKDWPEVKTMVAKLMEAGEEGTSGIVGMQPESKQVVFWKNVTRDYARARNRTFIPIAGIRYTSKGAKIHYYKHPHSKTIWEYRT